MNDTNTEETYRLCCPDCGFEAPPFEYTRNEAEEARQRFSPDDCPGCGSPIETLAVIPAHAAELNWDNIEEQRGITLGDNHK